MKAITPDQTRQKILDVLAKKGMSPKELIDATGDNLNLYKYLRGKTHTISADRIAKIAVALDVSCDYLLTEDGDFSLEDPLEKIRNTVSETIVDEFSKSVKRFLNAIIDSEG